MLGRQQPGGRNTKIGASPPAADSAACETIVTQPNLRLPRFPQLDARWPWLLPPLRQRWLLPTPERLLSLAQGTRVGANAPVRAGALALLGAGAGGCLVVGGGLLLAIHMCVRCTKRRFK